MLVILGLLLPIELFLSLSPSNQAHFVCICCCDFEYVFIYYGSEYPHTSVIP